MKRLLASMAMIAMASLTLSYTAHAQRRPDTTTMTCAAARGLVQSLGAVVMGTGGQTYDRLVRHRGFCTPSEITEVVFAPTKDNPACYVGDRCVERLNDVDR
jgi:hypothetical protein